MGRFHREYLLRLPLPLAQLYGRANNAKDARGRHDNAFYLFEALIKLTATPLIAAYRQEIAGGAKRDPELDRLLGQLGLPSLGHWTGFLRELAKRFGERADAATHPLGNLSDQLTRIRRDLPAALALYRRIKNGPDGAPAGDQTCSVLDVLDALVQYRNAVFGHGAGRSLSFFKNEMGPLLMPAAGEILAEGVIDPLGVSGSRLVFITEVRAVDRERWGGNFRDLTGLQSQPIEPIVLDADEAANVAPFRTAVLWPGYRLPLLIHPLLVYRENELSEEVLFLNRDRNGRQVELLSYASGRIERDRELAPALASLLSELTGKLLETSPDEVVGPASPEESATKSGRLLGDYQILCEIGRGGMGVVMLARQLSLGRLVALKMLPAELAGDPVALTRFRREMRALARCEHPNIVKVLASGTFPDGQLYYAMALRSCRRTSWVARRLLRRFNEISYVEEKTQEQS